MTEEKRTVFVVGATGTVGQEVTRALLLRGAAVLALVRSGRTATQLPAGVEPILGDLANPQSYRRALAKADAAFYLSPYASDEEHYARDFDDACRELHKRLIFVGSHIDAPSRVVRWLLRSVMGVMMPHYRAKFRLSERIRSAGGESILLVASHFFQNDEVRFVRDGLLRDGVYRLPLGHKAKNRVDARDIGHAAARAALDTSITPGVYPVVGPAALCGPDCAAVWSRVLQRDVTYEDSVDALARFEAGLENEFEGKKLNDLRLTSRVMRKLAVPTSAKQLAATTELLEQPPTDYESYARRSLATWREQQATDESERVA